MHDAYLEAQARLTAPGEHFATEVADVFGNPTTVFANAPRNLRDVITSTRRRGDATFIVYEDERWSFAEWLELVEAFGAGLVEKYGVTKGDRVAIAMRNYPEWTVAWAATVSIGAIAVSLNAWWTADELDYALGDCEPKVVVADTERVERMGSSCARRQIPIIGARLEEGGPTGDATDTAVDAGHDIEPGERAARATRFEDVAILGASLPEVAIDPDDDATILYTSGTTGRAKGAVSTHRAVISALWCYNLRAAIDRARTTAGAGATATKATPNRGGKGAPSGAGERPRSRPVFILIVPLFHVTGCIPVMLSCINSGLKLVVMHRWDPERALELIEAEHVTNFVGVPTQSADLLASPRFAEFDTASLRGVGGGGAPSPKSLVAKVGSSFANAKPTIAYGMTETNAYGPQNTGDDALAHPLSSGRTVALVDIEARDPDGAPLRPGETGELWMRGPNLIRGYWNNPGATAETIVDGWLASGDIGRVDADGFVYVSDRVKDMVLRGGENIYCAEVENVLYEHPGVLEVAVFGLPDDRLGETVAAAVMVRDPSAVTEADLRAFASARLAAFKVPDQIDVRSAALPRNAAGKFLKTQLRSGFRA